MTLENGKNLTIRKAKKEDAQEILNYLKKVGAESKNLLFGAEGLPYTVEQEEAILEDMNKSTSSALMVGIIDCRIICTGSISSPQRERISHQGNLALAVLKEFWGIGVGSCMMSELINFAKNSNKIEVLHLGVRADNTNAIALYKKFGFEEIGLYRKFAKIDGIYYDDFLMNLYLEDKK